MAIIHKTTMSPTKLELLAAWLPGRSWYGGVAGREPELARAGGFRLDDPEGEVGIEFMVVTDTSGDEPRSYHVPLTYRGAPLDGADEALIGTTEHGVLGTRWVYDGTHDPVLVTQVLALVQGKAEPQAQSESDTPDPTVAARLDGEFDPDRVAVEAVRVPRATEDGALGSVTAPWSRADGESSRGVFFLVRER
ncbi:maltokinase N-terminal cap-like domain-containing protein [Streptomyces sp. TRM49041]|uniref:maltokinase N-terminal cap-like domain-containing protein n=1 Tax=Streptomyces sp. TRM49041 TaxID=2603216 RepID=UPI0011EC5CF7|nr:1,4-alpha-glucan branching protein [Streptomyces sp. TRM49041]